jgi:hypothetical protein
MRREEGSSWRIAKNGHYSIRLGIQTEVTTVKSQKYAPIYATFSQGWTGRQCCVSGTNNDSSDRVSLLREAILTKCLITTYTEVRLTNNSSIKFNLSPVAVSAVYLLSCNPTQIIQHLIALPASKVFAENLN